MLQSCTCDPSHAGDPRYMELKGYIDSLNESSGIAMPVLQEAQRIFGYLPLDVHKFISESTRIPIAELYGTTTFYSQFTTTQKGRHQISVCLGTACYVKGSQKLVDSVSETLGIKIGDTTGDGLFTLDATRCLGCCGLAPVMMIDDDVYAKLDDVAVIPSILAKYKR